MLRRLRTLLYVCCASLISTAGVPCASAANISSAELINAYRGNAQFQRAADASFRAFEARLSTHCADVTEQWNAATFVSTQPPVVDGSGKLLSVTWEERVPGVACGRSRLYRVRVSIAEGKGSMVAMLPGDGLSSPDLPEAEGAVKSAVRTLLQANSTCTIDVVDTRLRAEGMVDGRRPWTEEWTVSACGRQMKVPVQFTPLPQKGTDIDIETGSIRPVG